MKLKINDNDFKVKVCITAKEIKNGMQNKKFTDFDGMLFLMNAGPQNFWMLNCIIPLDIIFILDNKISKIHHNCPPCTGEPCERYGCDFANLVLELPGGTCDKLGIKEGDKINLSLQS